MNKLSALALGTALSVSLPLAALAQGTDLGVELDGGVGVELGGGESGPALDADVNTTLDAQLETEGTGVDADLGPYSYGDLDAAIQGAAAADLSAVTAETNIEIVTLSSLSDEDTFTAEAFTDIRGDFVADIGVLQSNVEDNPDIVAALEAEGYASEDVVGVWTQADGTLTVFVDDGGVTADGNLTTTLDAPETDAPEADDLGADGTVETEVEGEGEGEVTTP